MRHFWFYLSAGSVLGLTSALTPGPLTALLVSETLCRGPRAGLPIAVVPVFTDVPIIVLALFVCSRLSNLQPALGVLSLLGAAFLLSLACQNLFFSNWTPPAAGTLGSSFRKGLTVNLLNPNAYVFWFVVGAPMVLTALACGWLPTAAFFVGLYVLLLGYNVALVFMVAKGRAFLRGRWYLWTLRFLGVCLVGFACLFVRRALQAFGWIH